MVPLVQRQPPRRSNVSLSNCTSRRATRAWEGTAFADVCGIRGSRMQTVQVQRGRPPGEKAPRLLRTPTLARLACTAPHGLAPRSPELPSAATASFPRQWAPLGPRTFALTVPSAWKACCVTPDPLNFMYSVLGSTPICALMETE